MQELKVIGVEEGALLVASDEGARYRIPVDDVLQSRLRQSSSDLGTGRKLSPREIQTQIRAGMSAEDVSAVTGAPLDYVQRFEGPVLAEREFVIESALNVPVHTALDLDPLAGGATFGGVIRRRLVDASALNERWASWKEQGGEWVVKLTFTAQQIEHDARWTFDPKKSTLAPLNTEAVSLSQQGDAPPTLVPRLRAVAASDAFESTRFDSGAFVTDEGIETGPLLDKIPHGRVGAQFSDAPNPFEAAAAAAATTTVAAAPAAEAPKAHNQTADLLEALRRRRGERDPMDPDPEESMASHPTTGQVRLIDIPLDSLEDGPLGSAGTPSAGSTGTGPQGISRGSKRSRASMPSWDEIVFGARSDDDL
ncbi:hypothetical protein BH11ACT3_BH11ACT3_11250 [soil metagenome]